jgi:hypothetical protein
MEPSLEVGPMDRSQEVRGLSGGAMADLQLRAYVRISGTHKSRQELVSSSSWSSARILAQVSGSGTAARVMVT